MSSLFRLLPLVAACACGPGDPVWTAPPGVSLTRVEVLQGPQHLLMDEGVDVRSDVPLVAGREGIVRLHYRTTEEYDGRPITARLSIGTEQVEQEVTLYAQSEPGRISSTVNFDLTDVDLLEGSVELSAELVQWGVPTDVAAVRYPSEGTRTLLVDVPETTLRVHLVPFAYNADGSGRQPVLDELRLREIRDAILAHFPVANVELTVGDVQPLERSFDGTDRAEDWRGVLLATQAVRLADQPDPDVYYYGLARPFPTNIHCTIGSWDNLCIRGMAFFAGPEEPDRRVAVGVGYPDRDGVIDVMVHELGHNFGRRHAACGRAANPDPDFPNPTLGLGSDAWNVASRRLVDGDTHFDMMGYCFPTFISAYTYSALAKRMIEVDSQGGR